LNHRPGRFTKVNFFQASTTAHMMLSACSDQ
jgi:hypothetical protein